MNNLSINPKLQHYIETEIFPIYEKNEGGHGLNHIEYVINRSLKFAHQFQDINIDMVYTIAAFHDIGHHIDKDTHEILSAKMFYENENLKTFFNDAERLTIKEAIEDHRASSSSEPRSNYGKIVSSADRTTDIDTVLKRTHSYSLKHRSSFTLEEMIEEAYSHMCKKYGKNGYAKHYVEDPEYQEFIKSVDEFTKDKNQFVARYKEVNNIN